MLRNRPISNIKRQSGFTITELLITILLSLIVIAAVLGGYLAIYSSSINTLASSKLNQDLNALMGVMVRDLRRAGYSGSASAGSNPIGNPFNDITSTAILTYTGIAATGPEAATAGTATCITYAYDVGTNVDGVGDEDGGVNNDEMLGFRLNNGVVEMRTSSNNSVPNTCVTANNTWVAITDAGSVTVTTLNFDLSDSRCLNTREPDGNNSDGVGGIDDPVEIDCYVLPAQLPDADDITVETRQVDITLTGQLTNDTFVNLTLRESLRVRNDLVRRR